MLLVGMLDSPYVRRCAIAGTVLGLTFEHQSVSVFRHMDRFRTINPVIKAPSAVADDGTVLMESSLILAHMEDLAGRSLRPAGPAARVSDLRITGLGTVICEKAISIEYERKRPAAQHYQPWVDRVKAQLHEALGLLEAEIKGGRVPGMGEPTHGGIIAAVAWGFIRFTTPDLAGNADYPLVAAHAAACEATAPFQHWPIDRETP